MAHIFLETPFHAKHKDTITNIVIQEIKNRSNLFIRSDPSYEGGFNLPLTQQWLSTDFGAHQNSIVVYHDSRQLRYCTNGRDHDIIIGLRFTPLKIYTFSHLKRPIYMRTHK